LIVGLFSGLAFAGEAEAVALDLVLDLPRVPAVGARYQLNDDDGGFDAAITRLDWDAVASSLRSRPGLPPRSVSSVLS
jgi:hypothetical protein